MLQCRCVKKRQGACLLFIIDQLTIHLALQFPPFIPHHYVEQVRRCCTVHSHPFKKPAKTIIFCSKYLTYTKREMSGITGNKYWCMQAGLQTGGNNTCRKADNKETDRQTGIHAGKKTEIQPAPVLLMRNVVLCNNMYVFHLQ